MNTLIQSIVMLLARLGRSLRWLPVALRSLLPRPLPVLVPVPVRTDRNPHQPLTRRRGPGLRGL